MNQRLPPNPDGDDQREDDLVVRLDERFKQLREAVGHAAKDLRTAKAVGYENRARIESLEQTRTFYITPDHKGVTPLAKLVDERILEHEQKRAAGWDVWLTRLVAIGGLIFGAYAVWKGG